MRRVHAIGAASLAAFLAALTFAAVAARAASAAPDGPGTQSYLNLARKDCFATARSTTSKVWYSVADGVLSDVFSPNIEASNVNTLQYVVTDGRSFTDLQQRDMTYTVSSPDRSGMVCRVTSRDPRHRLRAGHRLPHRSGARQRGHPHDARAAGRHARPRRCAA